MEAGHRGEGIFTAVSSREQINFTFAPVFVRSYHPLDSSVITRGVKNETTLVYSLALAEPIGGILEPFQSIRDTSSVAVKICIGLLAALFIISTVLTLYLGFSVTKIMTEPILKLLDVMEDVNW